MNSKKKLKEWTLDKFCHLHLFALKMSLWWREREREFGKFWTVRWIFSMKKVSLIIWEIYKYICYSVLLEKKGRWGGWGEERWRQMDDSKKDRKFLDIYHSKERESKVNLKLFCFHLYIKTTSLWSWYWSKHKMMMIIIIIIIIV